MAEGNRELMAEEHLNENGEGAGGLRIDVALPLPENLADRSRLSPIGSTTPMAAKPWEAERTL